MADFAAVHSRLREILLPYGSEYVITRDDPAGVTLEVPGLSRYGMTAARIPELVTKARAASSMKGNPLPLTDAELVEIAAASL